MLYLVVGQRHLVEAILATVVLEEDLLRVRLKGTSKIQLKFIEIGHGLSKRLLTIRIRKPKSSENHRPMSTSSFDSIARRLSEILLRLNAGEALEIKKLAGEFDVNERTIRRDLIEVIFAEFAAGSIPLSLRVDALHACARIMNPTERVNFFSENTLYGRKSEKNPLRQLDRQDAAALVGGIIVGVFTTRNPLPLNMKFHRGIHHVGTIWH